MTGSIRRYGSAPFQTVVLHGGPGGIGSAKGLAEGLGGNGGTLEMLQSRNSVSELVGELREQILHSASYPVLLVGHSWGAWLAALYAKQYPDRLAGMILIGCGPLKTEYAERIAERRKSRFSLSETIRYEELLRTLERKGEADDSALAELGALCEKADAYCPLTGECGDGTLDGEMYAKVFAEAAELRKNGTLLECFRNLPCPLALIHGETDPHPPEGLTEPLKELGISYSFCFLRRCGHTPWRERYAKDLFWKQMETLRRRFLLLSQDGNCSV